MENLMANKNLDSEGTAFLNTRVPKKLKAELEEVALDRIKSTNNMKVTLTDIVIEALELGLNDLKKTA